MNSKELKAIEMINEMVNTNTKAAQLRATKALEYFNNRSIDSGYYGRITELYSCTEKSQKVRVSAQGKNDSYIKMEKNNKIVYMPVEIKTNGGRIESLYTSTSPKYIVYSMNIEIKKKNTIENRVIEPLIFSTETFLNILENCKAIKWTNGTNNERAIQVTSKKMYMALLDNGIEYNKDMIYSVDMF